MGNPNELFRYEPKPITDDDEAEDDDNNKNEHNNEVVKIFSENIAQKI